MHKSLDCLLQSILEELRNPCEAYRPRSNGVGPPPSSTLVPLPWSVAEAVDPEEMLVAALSNCHMLTFLHKAREAGFVVTAYRDQAEGVMRKTPEGKIAVTKVTLRPDIAFDGLAPDADQLKALHHAAHEDCFIASSVKTEVAVETPRPTA